MTEDEKQKRLIDVGSSVLDSFFKDGLKFEEEWNKDLIGELLHFYVEVQAIKLHLGKLLVGALDGNHRISMTSPHIFAANLALAAGAMEWRDGALRRTI
jgi:hypothetical protein